MDPTPPSVAIRASSSDTAAAGSARHKAQNAAVIAWWAANPVVPARSVSVLARSSARRASSWRPTGRRLPGQHLHGNGGVGRVTELVPQLGRLSGIGEGSGVVAEPRSRGREQGQRRHQDAERAAAPGLAQLRTSPRPCLAWVAQEPGGQSEEEQRPRVVTQRGAGDPIDDVAEQHPAGGQVATEGGGGAPREVREHPLLRVVVVRGLVDPGGALGDTGHVVEPEPGQRQLGECPSAVHTVEPLSGSGEQLDGVRHRTGVLLEHPEREQGPAVRPRRTRPVQDASHERPGSIGVSGQEGVRRRRRQPLSGQRGVIREQRSPFHRGRCGGVPLPDAALVRCADEVLRELR